MSYHPYYVIFLPRGQFKVYFLTVWMCFCSLYDNWILLFLFLWYLINFDWVSGQTRTESNRPGGTDNLWVDHPHMHRPTGYSPDSIYKDLVPLTSQGVEIGVGTGGYPHPHSRVR